MPVEPDPRRRPRRARPSPPRSRAPSTCASGIGSSKNSHACIGRTSTRDPAGAMHRVPVLEQDRRAFGGDDRAPHERAHRVRRHRRGTGRVADVRLVREEQDLQVAGRASAPAAARAARRAAARGPRRRSATVSTAASVGARSGAREPGGEPKVTSRGRPAPTARSSPRPPRTAPRPRGPGSSAASFVDAQAGPGWRCRASSATNTPAGHPINAPTTGMRKNPATAPATPATSTHPGRPAAVARRPLNHVGAAMPSHPDHPDHDHRRPSPTAPGARPRPQITAAPAISSNPGRIGTTTPIRPDQHHQSQQDLDAVHPRIMTGPAADAASIEACRRSGSAHERARNRSPWRCRGRSRRGATATRGGSRWTAASFACPTSQDLLARRGLHQGRPAELLLQRRAS